MLGAARVQIPEDIVGTGTCIHSERKMEHWKLWIPGIDWVPNCTTWCSEFDSTQEFADEVGELRAISGHMLGVAGVQIPEDNLDDLHSSREEDGTLETMDPRD
ncbi:hypothetical protein Tco_1482952 [Tanacetum coccineum]